MPRKTRFAVFWTSDSLPSITSMRSAARGIDRVRDGRGIEPVQVTRGYGVDAREPVGTFQVDNESVLGLIGLHQGVEFLQSEPFAPTGDRPACPGDLLWPELASVH